jgi:hypothetical protein
MKNLFKTKRTLSIFAFCLIALTISIFTKQLIKSKTNPHIKCLSVENYKCNVVHAKTPKPTTTSSVYMSDIFSPYYTDNFCKLNPHEKILGNIFSKGYNIRRNSLFDGNITVFKLQKKYSKITGLLAIPDNRKGNAVLSFWGDGILLSQFPLIPNSKPKDVSLNVTNVTYLTLKLDTNPFGPPICFMNVLIK